MLKRINKFKKCKKVHGYILLPEGYIEKKWYKDTYYHVYKKAGDIEPFLYTSNYRIAAVYGFAKLSGFKKLNSYNAYVYLCQSIYISKVLNKSNLNLLIKDLDFKVWNKSGKLLGSRIQNIGCLVVKYDKTVRTSFTDIYINCYSAEGLDIRNFPNLTVKEAVNKIKGYNKK